MTPDVGPSSDPDPVDAGRTALRNAQRIADARGWTFHVDPPSRLLPGFLGSHQPDAIAVGPGGGIVFIISNRLDSTQAEELAALAAKVNREPGWEFRLLYLNNHAMTDDVIAPPTRQQVQDALAEIETLASGGHASAAFIVGWAAFEALARLVETDGAARPRQASSPIQVVQSLAEQGYLDADAAGQMRALAKLRNAVVHGDLATTVQPGQLSTLLHHLRATVAEAGASV